MVVAQEVDQYLEKLYWQDIRELVHQIEPRFAQLVDKLSPGEAFPVYIARYPYGETIADEESFFLPLPDGSGVDTLSNPAFSSEMKQHLSMGASTMPFGMVLDKKIEYYIDLPRQETISPNRMFGPGSIFPLGRILGYECNRRYSANSVLIATSGSRSAFMLPSIGCVQHQVNLQNDYLINSAPAKSMYHHWQVFKDIARSKLANCHWNATLLLFSDIWEEHLYHDAAWQELRLYLYRSGWEDSEYYRNQLYYDIAFSAIQDQQNLRPNPYLTDTARYLFATATGAVPGYTPAVDEEALPLKVIQRAFIESYGMKKYIPTVMEPAYFYFEDSLPIYYSLQNPSTPIFSPKSRQASSTLFELRELAHIMGKFIKVLSQKDFMCSESILGQVSAEIEFSYYHNKKDRHEIVQPSAALGDYDARFNMPPLVGEHSGKFCEDARFLRGCIGLRKKASVSDSTS